MSKTVDEILDEALSQVPEKVIEQDKARIFSVSCVLYHLDERGTVNTNLSKAILRGSDLVRVVDDTGRNIGAANLFVEDRQIKAHIHIEYATPERLSIQNGDKVYAVPMGGIEVSGVVDGLMVGTVITVDSVLVSTQPHHDKRIEPVVEIKETT